MTRAMSCLILATVLAACADGAADCSPVVYYADFDGDGIGDTEQAVESCDGGPGYVLEAGDCDDSRADVYPGAPEDDCTDPVDYNCDGSVMFEDADEDGFAACEDCNDASDAQHPLADEMCDGIDNDCDASIDEAGAVDAARFYADADGDGYGDRDTAIDACELPDGYVLGNTDCDDTAATIYPGAPEICDAADSDCDGEIAEILVPSDYATIEEALAANVTDICVEPGAYAVALDLDGHDEVTIEGAGGSSMVTLSAASDEARIVNAEDGMSSVTLRGLTLTDASYASASAVHLVRVDTVVLDDLVFDDVDPSAASAGVVSYVGLGDTLTATDIVVRNCDVADTGTAGGMFGVGSVNDVWIDGMELYDNTTTVDVFANVHGAALSVSGNGGSTATVRNVLAYDNHATADRNIYGTLFFTSLGELTLEGIEVRDNHHVAGTQMLGAVALLSVLNVDASHIALIGNTTEGPTSEGAAYGFSSALGIVYAEQVSVRNMVVAGNTSTVQDAYGGSVWTSSTAATYENVTVHGNDTTATRIVDGAGFSCGRGTMSLTNASITDNTLAGPGPKKLPITAGGVGNTGFSDACTWSASHSNVSGNDLDYAQIDAFPSKEGALAVEPGFTDVSAASAADWDLTLAPGSALIDAGDPDLIDEDGTVSDIGAFGGPAGASW